MSFNDQPRLTGTILSIAPLTAPDLEPLFAAASDPLIWAGHPAKDRAERGVFESYFAFLLRAGGTLTVTDLKAGQMIGCSRYYTPPGEEGDIAIGFTFLARAHWGGATNLDLKRLMLGHAFETCDQVWFHIDPTNQRSQIATQRLGAVFAYEATQKLGDRPAPWLCYRLTKAAWHDTLRQRGML